MKMCCLTMAHIQTGLLGSKWAPTALVSNQIKQMIDFSCTKGEKVFAEKGCWSYSTHRYGSSSTVCRGHFKGGCWQGEVNRRVRRETLSVTKDSQRKESWSGWRRRQFANNRADLGMGADFSRADLRREKAGLGEANGER